MNFRRLRLIEPTALRYRYFWQKGGDKTGFIHSVPVCEYRASEYSSIRVFEYPSIPVFQYLSN